MKEKRFKFGDNWRKFLERLDDKRIAAAEKSLRELLGIQDLTGKTFLDAGSGSGLFSLAAMRLGASKVVSFDYDPASVECGLTLKERYFPRDGRWIIERGSVLDEDYLKRLGQFDVVYSWGVLHHTGDMASALKNAAGMVADGGMLAIAIYNTQPVMSKFWTAVKKTYVSVPAPLQKGMLWIYLAYCVVRWLSADLIRLKNPFARYTEYYRHSRGMSVRRDAVDWVGGYPFETASPDEVFDFFKSRGFILEKLKTCRGKSGNNEFLFRKA